LLGIVEVDETYVGGKHKGKRGRGTENKTLFVALVERGGEFRAGKVQNVTAKTLNHIIRENVTPDSRIMTDKFLAYNRLDEEFASHETVNHGIGEYVHGNAYTNTLEGWFSLLKRGVKGTFHHVSEQDIDCYVGELVFRYNNRKTTDAERAIKSLKGTEGKMLVYKEVIKKAGS